MTQEEIQERVLALLFDASDDEALATFLMNEPAGLTYGYALLDDLPQLARALVPDDAAAAGRLGVFAAVRLERALAIACEHAPPEREARLASTSPAALSPPKRPKRPRSWAHIALPAASVGVVAMLVIVQLNDGEAEDDRIRATPIIGAVSVEVRKRTPSSLAERDIVAALESRRVDVERCLTAADRPRGSGADAHVVRIMLDDTGRLTSISAIRESSASFPADACIEAALRRVSWPIPNETLTLDLAFSRRAPDSP